MSLQHSIRLRRYSGIGVACQSANSTLAFCRFCNYFSKNNYSKNHCCVIYFLIWRRLTLWRTERTKFSIKVRVGRESNLASQSTRQNRLNYCYYIRVLQCVGTPISFPPMCEFDTRVFVSTCNVLTSTVLYVTVYQSNVCPEKRQLLRVIQTNFNAFVKLGI